MMIVIIFYVGLIEERLLSIINPSSTTIADRGRDDNPPSGKNFSQTTRSHNPHVIEMPFVGDGTVMPPYEEPIVSPIAFTIGGSGFNVKDHIASNTDLTIAIGQNGANASIYGDDDCGDEMCGEATEREHACEDDESDWYEYCNCVVNCFSSGDTKTIDTSENPENLKMFQEWEGLDGEVNDLGFGALVGLISAYLFASTSVELFQKSRHFFGTVQCFYSYSVATFLIVWLDCYLEIDRASAK
jgi:hypothetical protein